jgi:hypothetical protein
MHHYFQKFTDTHIQFQEFKQRQGSQMPKEEKIDTDTTTNNTPHYLYFKTNLLLGISRKIEEF